MSVDLAELSHRCDLIAVQAVQLKQLIESLDEDSQANTQALKRKSKGLCVYCGEEFEKEERSFRGCHQKCYKKVNRLINSGQVSEAIAIENGWVLPAERGGRPMDADDPINRYLSEIIKMANKK